MKRIKAAYNAFIGRIGVKEVVKTVSIPYDVMRHQLGSVNPADIRYIKSMTHNETDAHNDSISNIFISKAFSLEIQSLIDTQVYWMAQQSDGGRQHDFGKGTINGLSLVLERFEQLHGEVINKNKPKEEVDKEAPFEATSILDQIEGL